MKKIRRPTVHRLHGMLIPGSRYRCRRPDGGWEGNIRSPLVHPEQLYRQRLPAAAVSFCALFAGLLIASPAR
ncbi:MAG TPA: hypothetical protein PLM79_13835 [Syntrophobacteraceae bacterium]|nr:hypothetical protein [Syntrophobacteraceae bacterium]